MDLYTLLLDLSAYEALIGHMLSSRTRSHCLELKAKPNLIFHGRDFEVRTRSIQEQLKRLYLRISSDRKSNTNNDSPNLSIPTLLLHLRKRNRGSVRRAQRPFSDMNADQLAA